MQPIIALMLSGSQFILEDFPLCLPPFFLLQSRAASFGVIKYIERLCRS